MELKRNIPSAAILMNSMRSMGYTFESAVADVIDNSISAAATEIQLYFPVEASKLYVAICDNGFGMDYDELLEAMKYGSVPRDGVRKVDDLGRFGLGLKSASLSQCRKLTVASKKNGNVSAFIWDIDVVNEEKDWYIIECNEENINNIPAIDYLYRLESGTVVVWENFDVLEKTSGTVYTALTKLIDRTAEHLQLIFHRFLNRAEPITIKVNQRKLVGYDPFLEIYTNPRTSQRRKISVPVFDSQGVERIVSVQPVVLPYVKDLTDEQKKMSGGIENYRTKQGFYIYRSERLIIWGTWFNRHHDELTKYARIKVDIPNTLDDIWSIDIKKQSACIPPSIEVKLRQAVDDAMDVATKAEKYRGRRASISSKTDYVWSRTECRGAYTYSINRDSRIFDLIKCKVDSTTWQYIDMVLEEIEKNVPYQQIYIDKSTNSILQPDESESRFADVRDKAKMLIKMLIDIEGVSFTEAKDKVFLSEPFVNFLEIKDKIMEDELNG